MRPLSTFTAKAILVPALAAVLVLAPNGAPARATDKSLGTLREQVDTTTVFLVRHAEKAAPGDPEFAQVKTALGASPDRS